MKKINEKITLEIVKLQNQVKSLVNAYEPAVQNNVLVLTDRELYIVRKALEELAQKNSSILHDEVSDILADLKKIY